MGLFEVVYVMMFLSVANVLDVDIVYVGIEKLVGLEQWGAGP